MFRDLVRWNLTLSIFNFAVSSLTGDSLVSNGTGFIIASSARFNSAILYSKDGMNWNQISSYSIRGQVIVSIPGKVMVSWGFDNSIAISKDGVKWTQTASVQGKQTLYLSLYLLVYKCMKTMGLVLERFFFTFNVLHLHLYSLLLKKEFAKAILPQ